MPVELDVPNPPLICLQYYAEVVWPVRRRIFIVCNLHRNRDDTKRVFVIRIACEQVD